MKKLLITFLLLSGLFLSLKAQDIIITHDAQRIDAVIEEISDTEIRYKRTDNLNGPTFVLSTSKIASIIFKNGDVQTFAAPAPQPTNTNTNTNTQPMQNSKAVYSVREAEDIDFVPGQEIIKSEKRGKYYYGNVEMDLGLYKDFLKLTCAEAYKQYQQGEGMVWMGAIFGGAMMGAALGLLFRPTDAHLIASGVLIGSSVAFGVPMIYFGGKKEDSALDIFNKQCSASLNYQQALSLNFGVTSNGVGLILNF